MMIHLVDRFIFLFPPEFLSIPIHFGSIGGAALISMMRIVFPACSSLCCFRSGHFSVMRILRMCTIVKWYSTGHRIYVISETKSTEDTLRHTMKKIRTLLYMFRYIAVRNYRLRNFGPDYCPLARYTRANERPTRKITPEL